MKAIVCTKYGTPEFLKMVEMEKPSPKENEVLIKIHATSVTSGDSRIRRADPFLIRLIFGWKKPRKSVLGVVVAGEIEAVGNAVTNFRVGDQVFGSAGMNFGAHAEYVSVSENAVLALMPSNMSYEEAAAIPFGATAALHFLRIAKLQPSQKLLIYGASGAIGSLAVQLAKNMGVNVTAVCSSSNIEMVKALGADKVIDYTKEDFAKSGEKYDAIFDTVGKSSFWGALKALNKKGYLLMASAGMGLLLGSAIVSCFVSKKIVSGVINSNNGTVNINLSLPLFYHRSRKERFHFSAFAQVNNGINPGIDSGTSKASYSSFYYANQSGLNLHFDLASDDQKAALAVDLPFYYAFGLADAFEQLGIADYSILKIRIGLVLSGKLAFNITGPLWSSSKTLQSVPFTIGFNFSPSQILKSN